MISDSWRKDGFGMNGSIRVSAKTVEDAITEASIQLGITSDKLEYEVIEKGSAGFLGIGMKQAVIEARRKVEEKQETEIVRGKNRSRCLQNRRKESRKS